MSNLILPQKWTSQPQTPVEIDWSNPITRGFLKAFIPSTSKAILKGSAPSYLLKPSVTGIGYSGKRTVAYWEASPTALISGNPTWSIVLSVVSADVGIAGGLGLYCERPNATQIVKIAGSTGGSGVAEFVCRDASGNLAIITSSKVVNDGKPHVLAFTRVASNSHIGYVDGINVGASSTNVNGSFGATDALIGADKANDSADFNGAIPLVSLWNRALSATEIKSLSDNPWQIFKAQSRRIWVGGVAGGDVTLAAAATSQATASANLTTAIPITAAALGIGTATASLSTAIPLSGVAASVASGSGALTAQVRLSADALAQAVSAAALSSGIILTAAAVAQAAAAGTLSSAIQLIASAVAQASAPASLTAGSSGLAANAQASASASAALTIQIQLSAAALAQATASASLTAAGLGLSATAIASASAQGDITTQIKLSAAALAEAIAVGGLTARIDLAANAITTADASAWMLTAVQLAADASVISTAAAALTGGSLSVVRYQALTVDVFPVELTVDVFPIILTADVF